MPRQYGQQYISFFILDVLLKQTDNKHPLKIKKIQKILENDYGVKVNDHTIGRNIKELQRLYSAEIINEDCEVEKGDRIPYKIEYDGSGKRGYKVTKRPCNFNDLQLLAQCISSARFISKTQEQRLLTMLGEFCSRFEFNELSNEVYLVDRAKTTNNHILSYIHIINGAIRNKNKIRFRYMKYTLQNREQHTPRKNGAFYTVSPFKILINEGNFYMLAYSGKKMTKYRIDRMQNVIELTTEHQEGADVFAKINMKDFTKRVFGMFGGEEKEVKIRFTNDLLDVVVDRFGSNGATYIPADKNHFNVHLKVEVSNMFFSWICGFRKKATIISPSDVVEDFKTFLADINQKYES